MASTLITRPIGVSVISQPSRSAKGLATRTLAPTKMAFRSTKRPSVSRAPVKVGASPSSRAMGVVSMVTPRRYSRWASSGDRPTSNPMNRVTWPHSATVAAYWTAWSPRPSTPIGPPPIS